MRRVNGSLYVLHIRGGEFANHIACVGGIERRESPTTPGIDRQSVDKISIFFFHGSLLMTIDE